MEENTVSNLALWHDMENSEPIPFPLPSSKMLIERQECAGPPEGIGDTVLSGIQQPLRSWVGNFQFEIKAPT